MSTNTVYRAQPILGRQFRAWAGHWAESMDKRDNAFARHTFAKLEAEQCDPGSLTSALFLIVLCRASARQDESVAYSRAISRLLFLVSRLRFEMGSFDKAISSDISIVSIDDYILDVRGKEMLQYYMAPSLLEKLEGVLRAFESCSRTDVRRARNRLPCSAEVLFLEYVRSCTGRTSPTDLSALLPVAYEAGISAGLHVVAPEEIDPNSISKRRARFKKENSRQYHLIREAVAAFGRSDVGGDLELVSFFLGLA
jgi:hypothetical protein